MKNKLNYKLSLLIIIFCSCANPQPPSGGPADKTPPEIVAFHPSGGTLNFKGRSISIEFSKYMNRSKVRENIFISPSAKLEFDWSGKELEIEIVDELDPDRTYALTLGTDYSDLKGNKPTEAFTLIFSAGDVIDTGMVRGKLFDDKPSGAFIYAYKIDGIDIDTLDIRNTKPDYWTQTGTNGNFRIMALKDGIYRIVAIRDQFKDEIYSEGSDGFGAPVGDVIVASGSGPDVELKIGPPIDKIKPQVYGAFSMSDRSIEVSFSEEIDPSSISQNSFAITDSAGNNSRAIASLYSDIENRSRIVVFTSQPLDTAVKWKVTASDSSGSCPRDTIGYCIDDTANTAYFFAGTSRDSALPSIISPPFPDSTYEISINDKFEFIFNMSVDQENFKDRTALIKLLDSSAVAFNINFISGNNFELTPQELLEPDTWYRIELRMDSLAGGNAMIAKDSSIILHFLTQDQRKYSQINGTLTDSSHCGGHYYVTVKAKNGGKSITAKVSNDGSWEFKALPVGIYTFEVFCDSDGSGNYSYGKASPFEFGERFSVIEREIEVKARWEIENIKLYIK